MAMAKEWTPFGLQAKTGRFLPSRGRQLRRLVQLQRADILVLLGFESR